MRQRDMNMIDGHPFGMRGGGGVKLDSRGPARAAYDLDVAPADAVIKPRPERFEHGFLGGEARRDRRRSIAMAGAVGLFPRG